MVDRLKGKVALISGAANGMGEAMAAGFAREGAVVYVGDIDEQRGNEVAAAIGAKFVRLDVTQEQSWKDVLHRIVSQEERLDVLVNNAGILTNKTIEDVDLATWNRVLEVNLTGVMLGCKYGIQYMKLNPGGGGSIINVSSSTSFAAHPDIAYTTAKSGMRMLTRSVAVQAGRKYKIRCNNIAPGVISTSMTEHSFSLRPELRRHYESLSPLNRIGSGSDIAAMAIYLASDESGFVTGADFSVDGGSLAAHPGF